MKKDDRMLSFMLTATARSSGLYGKFLALLRATQRNHALEHATIHILSHWHPAIPTMGRSTPSGFYIYGNVPTEAVMAAASEAIRRLSAGEHHLAIHPRCGTNLAIGALVSGCATMVVVGRRRRSLLEEFPQILLAISAALFLAQPLGYWVQQRVTTRTDMHSAHIAGIERCIHRRTTAHFVRVQFEGE